MDCPASLYRFKQNMEACYLKVFPSYVWLMPSKGMVAELIVALQQYFEGCIAS